MSDDRIDNDKNKKKMNMKIFVIYAEDQRVK